MSEIRTFSGTHDFHPTVLADTDADDGGGSADDIIWNIEHGICPRCEGPLPTMPEYPAGSRITKCRTIPICNRCGTDEAYEQCDAAKGIGYGGISSASCWPLPIEEIDERRERCMREGHLVAVHVDRITNPRNTGGWNQYGQPNE
jgi:hypothetical protein